MARPKKEKTITIEERVNKIENQLKDIEADLNSMFDMLLKNDKDLSNNDKKEEEINTNTEKEIDTFKELFKDTYDKKEDKKEDNVEVIPVFIKYTKYVDPFEEIYKMWF